MLGDSSGPHSAHGLHTVVLHSIAGDPPLQAVCAALLQSWCAQTLLLSFGLFFCLGCTFSFFSCSPHPAPQHRINYSECEQIVVVAIEAVTGEEREGEAAAPLRCVPVGSFWFTSVRKEGSCGVWRWRLCCTR